MSMDDKKITIIEGPPPTFEIVYDNWANSIIDASTQASVAVTRLRTLNGPELVERCYHAWNTLNPINLEFRSPDGNTLEVPIVAARSTESQEGQLLILWVRLPETEIEIDFLDDDEFDEDGEDEIEEEDLDPSV